MDIEIVDAIFDYSQTLRSSEDVITGIFATALDKCPTLRDKILIKMGINFSYKKEYFLNTGFSIKNYQWCKGVDIRPDLLISNEEWWEEETFPHNEKLVLIESKLWASLPKSQEDGYRDIRNTFINQNNNNIINILISMKKIDSDAFDKIFTWNEIFRFFDEIHNCLKGKAEEKELLGELIKLMKVRLTPYLSELRKDNGVLCPKKILTEIKKRLKSKSFKPIHKTVTIYEDYDEDYFNTLKSKFDITKESEFSYFKFNAKRKKYSINCAILDKKNCSLWIEDENTDDVIILKEPYQINFADKAWGNNWFDALFGINDAIQTL